MRAAGGQDPFLLQIQALQKLSCTRELKAGSRVRPLGIASGHPPEAKEDPETEYGRRKMSGNKTKTLEELRSTRKWTSNPSLKLQKCDK